MTDVEKLQEAAKLVGEVMANLRPDETTCEHCEHRRYGNWVHKTVRDVLTGALGRLEKSARALSVQVDGSD